jgi:hypothetical protein
MCIAQSTPQAGGVYYPLNRGNSRMEIFTNPGDFQSILKLLEQARRRHSMLIPGHCLMDNWHLVVWPRCGGHLPEFIGRPRNAERG